MRGYVQFYTGNGKGKTTAAFGLAIRALMAGKRVYVGQFVKSMKYNETKLENFLDTLTIEQYGRGCFIIDEPEPIDVEMARAGLERCRKILSGGEYDMVILDEVCIALYYRLFSVESLISVLNERKERVEVILTGRYAPQQLIDYADLVTEMGEVKHYYRQGVEARDGIER